MHSRVINCEASTPRNIMTVIFNLEPSKNVDKLEEDTSPSVGISPS